MKQVALIYPYSTHWWAEFYLGVAAYAEQQGNWTILISPPTFPGSDNYPLTLHNIQGWRGDGVITHLTSLAEVKAAEKLNIPLVNISSALETPSFSTIMLDQEAVGRLAAQHLLKCGFQRLAYIGSAKYWYARQQLRGINEVAKVAGIPVEEYRESPPAGKASSWLKHREEMDSWLKTLQTPIGLIADGAYRARTVVDGCQRLGIAVPHDIAVISGDNQPVICEYSLPPITAVAREGYRHGFEAARLLDQLMRGIPVDHNPILVPPTCVIMRRSTDTITVGNPYVTTVVRYMYDHIGEPFGIKQLLRVVPISRRMLEKYFQEYLRCTPHEYLCWIRVEKAKQLFQSPGPLNIQKVAKQCGFLNTIQLRTVFKRLTRQSPTQYLRYLWSKEKSLGKISGKDAKADKRKALLPENNTPGTPVKRPVSSKKSSRKK